jgi:4-hydroxy-tetrahydrodipicolinate synthase
VAGRLDALNHTLIPAVPVPFDEAGRIAGEAQRAYAAWMAGQPVGAVALWVHTGRGLWLTAEQRAEVLETWREAAPGLPLVCGVGVPRSATQVEPLVAKHVITHTVEMARSARAGGAAAVMVYPPAAFRRLENPDERIVELHRAVAEVGLPTIAFYLYEAAGGLAYSSDVVRRLLGLPGVIGIKLATLDSVMTYQELAAAVQAIPSRPLLITGEDRFLGYSLMAGAGAALIGMGAACTDMAAAVLAAWYDGRLPDFVRLSGAIDRFARATFTAPMEGYVQRMLWALAADGVLDREYRDPFGPALGEDDRERVRRAVAELRRGG